jgi:predicted histidine transporter YuiF (NhaC family)
MISQLHQIIGKKIKSSYLLPTYLLTAHKRKQKEKEKEQGVDTKKKEKTRKGREKEKKRKDIILFILIVKGFLSAFIVKVLCTGSSTICGLLAGFLVLQGLPVGVRSPGI